MVVESGPVSTLDGSELETIWGVGMTERKKIPPGVPNSDFDTLPSEAPSDLKVVRGTYLVL